MITDAERDNKGRLKQKRPQIATRDAGLQLRAMGYTLERIGILWNVSKQRVWRVIYHQAKKPGRPKTV